MTEQTSRFSAEEGYLPQDQDYLLAQEAARQALAKGHIKAYSCRNDHERGRIMEVQSDQGWDPNPLFVEFEEPTDNMAAVCQ